MQFVDLIQVYVQPGQPLGFVGQFQPLSDTEMAGLLTGEWTAVTIDTSGLTFLDQVFSLGVQVESAASLGAGMDAGMDLDAGMDAGMALQAPPPITLAIDFINAQ